MKPFSSMTGAAIKGILLAALAIALAVAIAVSAFPAPASDVGGMAVSYSLSGDDVVITAPAGNDSYSWTVTDDEGGTMNASGEGVRRIVLTTSSEDGSTSWSIAGDSDSGRSQATGGGYTVELTAASGGVIDRCTDWFRVSDGSLWTGFDVKRSDGTYTFSDNTGGEGGRWTLYDLLHTAYAGTGPLSKPYAGVPYDGASVTEALGPGMYRMVLSVPGPDGRTTEYQDYVRVDGQIERSFSWTYAKWSYGGSPAGSPAEFTATVSFTLDDILRASFEDAVQRDVIRWMEYDGITGIVDPTGVAASLETQLCQQYIATYGPDADVTGQGYADFILAFVLAAIDYPSRPVGGDTDTYVYGQDEYWALPLQTVYHGLGDCEDTAALCASICMAAGYDVGIGIKPGHAYAIVALDGYVPVSDYTDSTHDGRSYTEFLQYESGGRVFYTCDTHHDGFVLPAGYLCADGLKRTYFVA